ncbi:MAG: hypothetical protein IPJ69_08930 [Deltaproteobacteria bacterium]|nr:MAG: hypothetical protein IPJ69_08930 [Deltaproteobacteria bacterium]
MKKLSAIVMAIALVSSAAAFAGEAKAHPCKGLKGKERAECVKAERAKKAEAKPAAKPAGEVAK